MDLGDSMVYLRARNENTVMLSNRPLPELLIEKAVREALTADPDTL